MTGYTAILSAALVLCRWTAYAAPPAAPSIDVAVLEPRNQAVAGALVQLKAGNELLMQAETDAAGHANFADLKAGFYEIAAGKQGYVAVEKRDIDLTGEGPVSIELTLIPAMVRKESIEVKETVAPVEAAASTPETLRASEARELPGRPATVADALPLTPGVVREPGGGLRIAAAAEHRSSLIVNSADVTDPATGQFGLTVPIDSAGRKNMAMVTIRMRNGQRTEIVGAPIFSRVVIPGA